VDPNQKTMMVEGFVALEALAESDPRVARELREAACQATTLCSGVLAMRQAPDHRFAPDSPLEGDGFEPSVPHRIGPVVDRSRS
jgi:hypothetical protein